MKIRITAAGIFGVEGELPVGTELDVESEPAEWAGRYEVIADKPAKVAVTNPAKGALPSDKAD